MPKLLSTDPRVIWPAGRTPNWVQKPDGVDGGRFGFIEHAVICKPDGTAIFDRYVTKEGSHVITLPFGQDPSTGEWKIGLVMEARDTAAPADGVTSLSFWGPARGFRDENETAEAAARREAGQEAGASVILSAVALGDFITNETTTTSWSPFVALNVDLSRLQAIAPEQGEKIYKSKFFTLQEVEEMILHGTHEGAYTTSMVLITTVMLYRLHILPELGHANTKARLHVSV